VYVYSARLGLTSRPFRPLRLNARYSYDERDNQTPQSEYFYDALDSGVQQPAGMGMTGVINQPLSYRKHKANVDANYRFSSRWSASAGYEYRDTEREYSDVEESREHTGKAGIKWRVREDTDAALRVSRSSREVSDYQPELGDQNPLLRKYNLADRDRDSAGVLLNYAPTDKIDIGLSADLVRDDYDDSELGLSDADSGNVNVSVGYYPTANVQFNAFYSYDQIESRQHGSDPGAAPTPLLLYQIDFDDEVHTVGLGANLARLWRRWDLGVNYTYSIGESDILHTDLNPVGVGVAYPTLSNEMHRLELTAQTDLSKATHLKVSAIYESLTSEDWAVDGVSAYPDNNLLTLGNESEDYDVFAFVVAVQHSF